MREVYCAVYRNDADVSEVRAPALEAPAALEDIRRRTGADLVAGDALTVFADVWPAADAERLPEARGSATDIARLAQRDVARGLAVAAAEAAPVYVRDRVALTIDERHSGIRA
jgi:tRNA threonylcarbamoyladenosine biosynthesis protein TsaB